MERKIRPSHFYKYRSLADLEKVRDILANNRLYWPSPNQFNDPFDCAAIPTITGNRAERIAYARRIVARNLAHAPRHVRAKAFRELSADNLAKAEAALPDIFRKRIESVGVCSLAEEPDNFLMWSHYADSHRGVCLRFTPPVDDEDMFPLPVKYSAERPVVDMADERDDEWAVKWAEKVLLMKADYWCYEREWRAFDIKGPGMHGFSVEILDAVYLGALIDEGHKENLIRLSKLRRAPMKLYQMRLDDRAFRLHAEEIR
jgi:hypothetical protein